MAEFYEIKFTGRSNPGALVRRAWAGESAMQAALADWPDLPRLLGLGMPADGNIVRAEIPGAYFGQVLARYRLELLGVVVANGQAQGAPLLKTVGQDGSAFDLQLWLQRVFVADSPVYGEALWTPEQGLRRAICGVELARTEEDLYNAWRALKTIQYKQAQRGRPRANPLFTREELLIAVREMASQGKTRESDVMEFLGLPDERELRRQFRRLLFRNWREVLEAANCRPLLPVSEGV